MLIVTPDLNRNSRKNSQTLTLSSSFFTSAPSNSVMVRG
jgi:hypothetical protein